MDSNGAVGGGRNDLADLLGTDIAYGVDPRNLRFRGLGGGDIAPFVQPQFSQ